MRDVDENSPAYRLGVALYYIQVLLGNFGRPQDFDIEAAREFLKSEDERMRAIVYGV